MAGRHILRATLAFVLPLALAGSAGAQATSGAVSLPMPGIDTFHPVTATIACGSNARPEAMKALAQAGFKSVISFRQDGEEGYDRAAAERAATAAGLTFVSIPVDRQHPDPAAVQRFLDTIGRSATAPAYIYCHTGQRAAMMWMIKRVKQDGWTPEQALSEAATLGLTRAELKAFALEYVGARPAAK